MHSIYSYTERNAVVGLVLTTSGLFFCYYYNSKAMGHLYATGFILIILGIIYSLSLSKSCILTSDSISIKYSSSEPTSIKLSEIKKLEISGIPFLSKYRFYTNDGKQLSFSTRCFGNRRKFLKTINEQLTARSI
jgi:hypothetical protein